MRGGSGSIWRRVRYTRAMATAVLEPRLKLTYAEYVHFPEDGRRHELFDGEHFVAPAPNTRHHDIVLGLASLLRAFVMKTRLGRVFVAPFDVVLSAVDVLQPDVLVVSNARSRIVTVANVQGAPDLVVEVLSPATRERDETLKLQLYQRAGVEEYWLVDPDGETVRVHRRAGAGFGPATELALARAERLTTPLLPGFELPLAELFADPAG